MDLLKVSCYFKTIYEPHLTIYEPRIRNGVEPVATCKFKSSIVLFIYLFIYLILFLNLLVSYSFFFLKFLSSLQGQLYLSLQRHLIISVKDDKLVYAFIKLFH